MKMNLEYRKGIIFLRLEGSLTKRTVFKLEDKINELIENELNNIVLNMSNLKHIDICGISSLYYIYDVIKRCRGSTYICLSGNNKIEDILNEQNILNYILKIDSELKAFELIKI